MTLKGLHVLVVDANDDQRELLEFVLRLRGAKVTTASTVCEALAAVDRERPDVLVSEISLPDADGYELVRRLRTRDASRGGRTPAVAVTGWAGRQHRKLAMDSGFQAHLPKPVPLDGLVAVIVGLAVTSPRGARN
jgi:CheY-like chemotaxis protein